MALTAALARGVRAALRGSLDELTARDRDDPALAFFDENRREPVMVSDLDTASCGRDVLVVGVGCGSTPHGGSRLRLPSLAGPDAGQRLARVTSLARKRLVVVSSLSAADLDCGRTTAPEVVALRELLALAEGRLTDGVQNRHGADPLLADLASRLEHDGLLALPRVGPGPTPVELAVGPRRSKERFLVAVETDGAEYARLTGVRERERLRVEQLQALGWIPLRVWSTDLYRDPAREVARVLAAVRQAHQGVGGRGGKAAGEPGAGASTASWIDETTDPRLSPSPPAEERGATGGELPAEEPGAGRGGLPAEDRGTNGQRPAEKPEATSGRLPAEPVAGRAPAADPGLTPRADRPEDVAAAPDAPGAALPTTIRAGDDGPDRAEPSGTDDTPRGRRRRWRRGRSTGENESNWDEFFDADARERWLREQRPPHWE